jgi:hypothetical protein
VQSSRRLQQEESALFLGEQGVCVQVIEQPQHRNYDDEQPNAVIVALTTGKVERKARYDLILHW